MKLILVNNDYRYAAEQSILNYFPPDTQGEATVILHRGETHCTATVHLTVGDKTVHELSRMRTDDVSDDYERVRREQSAIKFALYRAALEITGVNPPWGALTGIRPAKLATELISKGTRENTDSVLDKLYGVAEERRGLCLDAAEAGIAVKKGLEPRDIALYIGIPFCPSRCAYCSFVSLDVHKSGKLKEPFVRALRMELEAAGAAVRKAGKRVVSVYWGGGTPTALPEEDLSLLLSELESNFELSYAGDYTVEAGRPDTLNAEMLLMLKSHGVTRISINPQTMDDEVLRGIGRAHTAGAVTQAVALARGAGFEQINMDVIAGLPGDTAGRFMSSLDAVLSLKPENLTVHTLSKKRGSEITVNEVPVPSAEDVGEMLSYSMEKTRQFGYSPYYLYRQKYMAGNFENVGYCLPGHENVYNIIIMEELATILSLGAGGVSKLVDGNRISRVFNPKYAKEYIERIDDICNRKHDIFAKQEDIC